MESKKACVVNNVGVYRDDRSVMLCNSDGNIIDYLPAGCTDGEVEMWISGYTKGSKDGCKIGIVLGTKKVQDKMLDVLGIERI